VSIFAHGDEIVVVSIFYMLPRVKIEDAARDGDSWMQPCGAAGQGLAKGDVTGSRGSHESQDINCRQISPRWVSFFANSVVLLLWL